MGPLGAEDELEQRGLAGPRGPGQEDELALLDVEGQVDERGLVPVLLVTWKNWINRRAPGRSPVRTSRPRREPRGESRQTSRRYLPI